MGPATRVSNMYKRRPSMMAFFGATALEAVDLEKARLQK